MRTFNTTTKIETIAKEIGASLLILLASSVTFMIITTFIHVVK